MIDEKKQKLQKRMAALHEKFFKQLPSKYFEIENSWKEYQAELSNADFTEKFYRLIHTLKGSAATFGFVVQADICFKIQLLLLKSEKENALLPEDSILQIQKYLLQLEKNINVPAKNLPE